MGVNMLMFALPFLLLVLGPVFVYSVLKSARAGEGVYDRGSSAYMSAMNWLGVLIGVAATAWAVWRVYYIVREALLW